MSKIIVIGEALIDKFINTNEIKEEIGGASLNVACALSSLGNEVFFAGGISKDEYGQKIKETFQNFSVNLENVNFTDLPTTIAEVTLNEEKDREFTFKRGSDLDFEIENFNLSHLDFNFVHFGSATAFLKGKLNNSYWKLKEFCDSNEIRYSFDPNFRNAFWKTASEINYFINESMKFLKTASFIKISDYELKLLMNKDNEQEAIKAIKKIIKKDSVVCITRGKEDTVGIFKDELIYEPVINEDIVVVDTTGAGDAFASKSIDIFCNSEVIDSEVIKKLIYEANLYAKKSIQKIGALTYLLD